MNAQNTLVFSTQKYQYLKQAIISQTGFGEGLVDMQTFPDGEHYIRITSALQGKSAILIGGTISDADTLELYDLACGLAKYGALSLTLVIPYFGYSTMERAVKYGEVVTAKTRAMLLSAIPRAPMGNTVMLVDLHTEGIPHYFEADIVPVHVYGKEIVKKACADIFGSDFVMASTDAGRAKWVESLANDMQVDAAFLFKRRLSGSETQVAGINADVKGKKVIIYDDMIRTGGSLISAAKAYKEAGATDIAVITTHGLFVGGIDKLKNSGMFTCVASADTHPNALALASESNGFLKIYSVADILAEQLKNRQA